MTTTLFLALSLALHGLALRSLTSIGGEAVHVLPAPSREPIEVIENDEAVAERVVPHSGEETSIVRTERGGAPLPPKSTGLLSDRDQSVEAETKASRIGRFRSSTPEEPTDGLSMSDLGIGPMEGEVTLDSATDDHLPGVADGEKTVLSTRRYAHWSYMERIRDRVAPRWISRVQRSVDALSLSGRDLGDGERATKIFVELSAEGAIENVSVAKSSGSRTLDALAVAIFREAGPFPNPPKALVRSDGTIHVRWKFVVRVVKPTPIAADAPVERSWN